MNTDNIIQLLGGLALTRSYKEQLDLIKDFFLLEKDIPLSESQAIIKIYKEQFEKQSNLGKEYIKRRVYSKSKKPRSYDYKAPKFFKDYSGKSLCATCGNKIESRCAFRHKVEGKYNDYHCISSCFPEQYKYSMSNDKDYIKAMEIKK